MGYATIVKSAWKSTRKGYSSAAGTDGDEDENDLKAKKKAAEKASGFGARDVGWIGSLCLMCNNIIGPGLFQLPGLFQTAGWVPCVLCLLIAAVWTTQSGLYLSRTMAEGFKENKDFSKRLEFNRTAWHLLPTYGYYIAVFTLCCVFFTQNLANILMTSQVFDETLLAMFQVSCALDLSSFTPLCIHKDSDAIVTDSLFGSTYVLSVGFICVLIVCIPLGYLNLDDNISIQVGGMILTLVCVIVWVANFVAMGLQPSFVPAFGTGVSNFTPLLSTVLFNYGFVATIPSWLNEKAPRVEAGTTIVWANIGATTQYFLIAVFGALAVRIPGGSNTDLLSIIDEGNIPGIWSASQVCTYIFPLANVLTSIPVYSIVCKYNIMQLHGYKVPVWLANLIAVVLPWIVVIPFYPGNTLDTIITWSSALFFVNLNMLLPLLMYLSMMKRQRARQRPIDLNLEDLGKAAIEAASSGPETTPKAVAGDENSNSSSSTASLLLNAAEVGSSSTGAGNMKSLNNETPEDDDDDEEEHVEPEDVHILPKFCLRNGANETVYANALLLSSIIVALATFALQITQQELPASSDDDDNGPASNGNSTKMAALDTLFGFVSSYVV